MPETTTPLCAPDPLEDYRPLRPAHPVFVTADGRPRRRGRLIATSLALTLGAWMAAIVVGGTGFTGMPALRVAPLAHRSSTAAHARAELASDSRERRKKHDARDIARAAPRQSKPAST